MEKKLFQRINQRIAGLIVLLLLALLPSCGKEMSHKYVIINNSNHDIYQLTFCGEISGQQLSINKNETSKQVMLSFERRFRLTPRLMCLSIDDFSGSSNFNSIINQPRVPFSNKDVDNDLNTILITSEEIADSLTFNIKLN